jgi:hypothetical protein
VIHAIVVGEEQARSIISELRQCLKHGSKSILIVTSDDEKFVEALSKLKENPEATLADIPSPEAFYIGGVWTLGMATSIDDWDESLMDDLESGRSLPFEPPEVNPN